MKLEFIREFLVLAEILNFSTASKKLYISQPTRTRHIQCMERELGYRLFHTTSHGIRLTQYGEAAIRPFRNIIKDYQFFMEKSRQIASQVKGTLKVGLLYYAIDDHFAAFLTHLQSKYQNVHFVFKGNLPQMLLDDLYAGSTDIASLITVEQWQSDEVEAVYVAKTSLIAVVRDDDPISERAVVTLEELVGHSLIMLSDDTYSNEITEQILQSNHITIKERTWADTLETMPLTVHMTGGIHITGENCKRQRASGVAYIPIIVKQPAVSLVFSCMRDCQNPLGKLFFDEARNYFAQGTK